MNYKFRVWDKETQDMLLFENIFNDKPYTETSTFPQYDSMPEYHKTITMPYIGFNDRNDKEIFEYDIVRFSWDGVEKLWLVKYKPNVASFVLSNAKDCIWFDIFDSENMEVVGNKFNNPELYSKIFDEEKNDAI